MRGGGILDIFYSLLFIVAVIGALVLGGWIALKFTDKKLPPPDKKKPVPQPQHEGCPWGPGPWGDDPCTHPYTPGPEPGPEPRPKPGPGPGPEPGPGPKPAPGPGPGPDNFKPVLNLLSAKFDPVNRYIQVGFKILADGSPPPNKSYTISYDILNKGVKTSQFPEDEPLTEKEMNSLQQTSLVPVTGAPSGVAASDLTVSAQIHFRENGTMNSGVVGVPVTINVS